MTARIGSVGTLLALGGAVLAAACGARATATPGGPRSSVEVTSCGAGTGDSASLDLVMQADPTPREGAEALVRIEGETMKTSIRMNPMSTMRFSLPRGLYDARITLDGYGAVEGRTTLTGGCEARMTVTLRRR